MRWERLEESERVSKRGTRLILHPNKPVLAAAINTPCGALFAPIGRPHPRALKLTQHAVQLTRTRRDPRLTLFPRQHSFPFAFLSSSGLLLTCYIRINEAEAENLGERKLVHFKNEVISSDCSLKCSNNVCCSFRAINRGGR